jgi:hypothetical protein
LFASSVGRNWFSFASCFFLPSWGKKTPLIALPIDSQRPLDSAGGKRLGRSPGLHLSPGHGERR